MARLNFLLLFFLLSLSIQAQEEKVYDGLTLENLIEQFIESNELTDLDVTDIIERIASFEKHPININIATESELASLFILSPIEIGAILNHKEKYGNFIAIQELQTIEVLDFNKIKLLSNFLSVSITDQQKYNIKDVINSGGSTLFLKYKRVFPLKKGYKTRDDGSTPYVGSPDHYYMRYRFDSGRALKAGVTMEKDPGEYFFTGNNKSGFDFYSAYVYAEKIKPWLRVLSIGDYTISMGQGLIIHNAFGTGKSIYTVDIKKDGQTIKPYSSVNESNFFRGAAISLTPVKNSEISIFYSNKSVDGTVDIDTTIIDDFGRFSSIARDGLHRTESEIAKKGAVNQQNFGGRLTYRIGNLKIGLNHLVYDFSVSVEPRTDLYRLYNFKGNGFSATSVDYGWRYKNLNSFGEVSRSNNGGLAQIHSAILSLDKKLDLAISYRKFEKDYHTFEANAFSEGTLPVNEEGIYFGLENRINTQWKISSYLDFWKNPWLRFRVDAPGRGREFLIRVDHVKKRTYHLYWQYRYETKNLNSSLNTQPIDPIIFTHNHRMRLHFSYQINKEFEIRSRIEGSSFDKDGSQGFGYLLYQDIYYKPIALPISVNARVSLFDTDGFDTRIYTYENDLLYEFYIPFFSGQGMRSYLNFKYKIKRNLGWEFKLARTILTSGDTFSSGNELIENNKRIEFKTQLKYTF